MKPIRWSLFVLAWPLLVAAEVWSPSPEAVNVAKRERIQGQFIQAAELLQAAAERSAANSLERAYFLTILGNTQLEAGQSFAAAKSLRQSVGLAREAGGRGRELLASALNNLASAYVVMGRLRTARQFLEEAIGIVEERPPDARAPGALTRGNLLSNLSSLHMQAGAVDRAEELAMRALEAVRKEEGHQSLREAAILNNLGAMKIEQRRWHEAQLLMEDAIAVWKLHLGESHPRVGLGLSALANIERELGDTSSAEAAARRAVRILEAKLPPDHIGIALALDAYSRILRKTGRRSEAKSMRKRAESIRAESRDENFFGHTVDLSALRAGRERGAI